MIRPPILFIPKIIIPYFLEAVGFSVSGACVKKSTTGVDPHDPCHRTLIVGGVVNSLIFIGLFMFNMIGQIVSFLYIQSSRQKHPISPPENDLF